MWWHIPNLRCCHFWDRSEVFQSLQEYLHIWKQDLLKYLPSVVSSHVDHVVQLRVEKPLTWKPKWIFKLPNGTLFVCQNWNFLLEKFRSYWKLIFHLKTHYLATYYLNNWTVKINHDPPPPRPPLTTPQTIIRGVV